MSKIPKKYLNMLTQINARNEILSDLNTRLDKILEKAHKERNQDHK